MDPGFEVWEETENKEMERREKSKLARFRTKLKDSIPISYWGGRDLVSNIGFRSLILASDYRFSNMKLKRFLVDNAESMQAHGGRVKYLLETLFLKALGLDSDGVDLDFTRGTVRAKKVKDKAEIMKKLNDSEARPKSRVYTAVQIPLQQMFDDYSRQPLRDGKRTDLTIIVLTGGLWAGTVKKEVVNQTIIAFARELEKSLGGPPKDRPVSVKFIQVRKDPEATLRLRRLDNELKYEGVIDLVDTEHYEGDASKNATGKLRGSIRRDGR
ncbi:uncharacterized protein PAC_16220 [Phialocephala subalpina]|uniref:Uncharacterized protein n=1 Tax=Phialocephala subalpina TaxID=576137 RepID=A0A1L7XMQ8_9HELO|nr:uncharacterized protein PAC_16220 [Phialocephala subalpina]